LLSALGTVFDPIRFIVLAGCLAIVVCIPVAARRRKLHIPGYVGMAFAAFITALILGRVVGSPRIIGTPMGIFLSVVFFLLIATAVGSVVALFFYRHPEV
jgi:hypothetical protein